MIKNVTIICITMVVIVSNCSFDQKNNHESVTNSVGMKMIKIEAGSFLMGDLNGKGNWDESPVHRVNITQPFFVSETEVTIEQFQQFSSGYKGTKTYAPYATGISWHQANEFCSWLSKKEGKNYRLPTEAEWEYICRAGTDTPFSSGFKQPPVETANFWGVKNMHTGALEWCHDWYGEYFHQKQNDPAGPEAGFAKVVRGGLPDDKTTFFDQPIEFYYRSANRAGVAPKFTCFKQLKTEQEKPDESYHQFTPGLIGVLYDDAKMNKSLSLWRIKNLNSEKLHWQNLNDWSAIWSGFITVPFSGEITFYAEVESGLRFKIDDQLVIDAWEDNSNNIGKLNVVEGKNYAIEISYFKAKEKPSYMRIYWSWEGQEKTEIPESALAFTDYNRYIAEKKFNESIEARKQDPSIGFRVIMAPKLSTKPSPYQPHFVFEGVKQNSAQVKQGPDLDKPYFRKRYILPIPPENTDIQASIDAGVSPFFSPHNHDPGFAVCNNGDLFVVFFTSVFEDAPEVALMATRLRFGSDQWDWMSPFIDLPDVNDVAPMLWNEAGNLRFFFGNLHLDATFPFQWTVSDDNGATWSEINYPKFINRVGPHTPQPINSAFRDSDSTIYIACDGLGATSVLYASQDNGYSWYDTGGRSGGRHTTFALLKNGDIMGLGGKHSDIDGYMPKSISHEKGKSWELSKTPFPALGSSQRPTLIRLQSGNLFFASDFQRSDGFQPEGIKERGSFVALSEDEGKTWLIKKIPGGQLHESEERRIAMKGATLGYAAAKQAPNGIIHLIATMTHPCLHFAMNEAWILEDEGGVEDSTALLASKANSISAVKKYVEKFTNGNIKLEYEGGIADDGRFLIHGKEHWYYENGQKKYEAHYVFGKKSGTEIYWDFEGRKKWERNHQQNGVTIWKQYWPNGKLKAKSSWRNKRCEGIAQRWDYDGKLISEAEFVDGKMVDKIR